MILCHIYNFNTFWPYFNNSFYQSKTKRGQASDFFQKPKKAACPLFSILSLTIIKKHPWQECYSEYKINFTTLSRNGKESVLFSERVTPVHKHEIIARIRELFKSGNISELSRMAKELLVQNADVTCCRHWLSLSLAAMVYEEEALPKRMPLLTALASLDEKQQPLHIEYCHDREEIADELGKANKWTELLSLLRSSLLRWQPDTESPTDLVWLTKCFRKTKENCRSLKAELILNMSGGGTFKANSSSYMNIFLVEALSAEANAWHRCLRGPGGVNLCLANLWLFAEEDFFDEFMSLLNQDPVAYMALVNEAAENRGSQGLENILQLENLLQGVQSSQFCLLNFLQECLLAAAGSARSLNEVNLALLPTREKLVPLLKDLTEEPGAS